MKTFYKLFSFLLLCTLLISCNNKNENKAENKETSVTETETKNVEMETKNAKVTEEVKENPAIGPRFIVGTKSMALLFHDLSYVNVVAIPEGLDESIYPDAIVFGPEDNPDFEVLSKLEHKTDYDVFITDNPDYLKIYDKNIFGQLTINEGLTDEKMFPDSYLNFCEYLGLKNTGKELLEKYNYKNPYIN